PRLVAFRAREGVANELRLERVHAGFQAQAGVARGPRTAAGDVLGQLGDVDAIVGEDEGAADLVLELPDVAGPRKAREAIHRRARHLDLASVLVLLDEVRD